MEQYNERDGQLLSLRDGFQRTNLTFFQAWTMYHALGGSCSPAKLSEALRGVDDLAPYEHNRFADVLNQYYAAIGQDHPVGYRLGGNVN